MQPVLVNPELKGQKFDGNLSIQLRVLDQVDLTHAALCRARSEI
jgi:hypothetical protein